jgi:hypothetical protein
MQNNHSEQVNTAADDLADFIPIWDLPLDFPALFTKAKVQWMMRQRHENGLEKAIIKIGKTMYVHLPSLRDWVIKQRS